MQELFNNHMALSHGQNNSRSVRVNINQMPTNLLCCFFYRSAILLFCVSWRSAIFLSISQDSLPSTPRMFLCRGSVISLDDWWSLLAMSGSMSMPPRWVCRENSLLLLSLMFTLPQIAVINLNSSNHFHNCYAIPNRIVFFLSTVRTIETVVLRSMIV